MNGITFIKPLTLNDRLLIDTVTTRYEGVEAPFLAFDRGDHIELMIPQTIRRVSYGETKAVAAPTVSTGTHGGLSDG